MSKTKHVPAIKEVPGYPGYAADSAGFIWSTASNWRGYGVRPLTFLKDRDGYYRVRLVKNGRRIRRAVHSLIAVTFIGQRPSSKHEVRHLNGIKCDNRSLNLSWGTRKENADDRERHGHTSRGISHSIAIKNGLKRSGRNVRK
jgi:hypothetical protein